MGHVGTHAASVALYPKLAYDPRTDFEPIALINGAAIVVVAKKDFPPKDFKEFVAYLKANETKVNQAHAGVGAVSYITCELLNGIIGIKPVGVPFQGTGPAMNALVGGQVDYMCDQITNVVPQVNGGTIKAYAVATAERSPSLPNLPTSAEGGPAELPGLRLECAVRAEGHAEGDHRQAQCRRRQGAGRREGHRAHEGARQRHPEAGAAHASGARQAREGRSRQVGQVPQADQLKTLDFSGVDNGGGGVAPPLSFWAPAAIF